MPLAFEQTGWSRINLSPQALDPVEAGLAARGLAAEAFDLAPHVADFNTYLRSPDYAGEYQTYGGEAHYCLLEKALEHYLSLVIAAPRPGQVAVDIGSCRSVVPGILRQRHGVRCYEQDLVYPPGVDGDRIGSGADAIPLPDASVDFMTLHCTFEHFEHRADTGFIRESARLLKAGGRTIILPLYLNANHCNITGEPESDVRAGIGFDPDADFYCEVPEWQNRFGRHYSPRVLWDRVIAPAVEAGLQPRLLRCTGWEQIDPRLWLRWILVLEKPSPPPTTSSPYSRTTAATGRFAPPGHFYSPHPRLEDIESSYATIQEAARQPGGLSLDDTGQLQSLERADTLIPVGPWADAVSPAQRHHYDNSFFRFGDSNAVWQMAQMYRPRRVIEVGSGYSTACWLDTFDALGLETMLTCIEPYPDRLQQLCRPADFSTRLRLHQCPVQEVPLATFGELAAGDVLFIDSTHVSKSGSDVNYLFFHVLPALAPSVVVHVHDIFWPFDYPLDWYREGRAWNECFLLRAFLQFNSAFRIVRFNSYLAQRHADTLARFDPRFVSDAGGSIWLERHS